MASDKLVQAVQKIGLEATAEKLGKSVDWCKDYLTDLRYLYDFDRFSEDKLTIVDRLGNLTKFKQNSPQRKFDDVVNKQVLAGKPIRVCLLKARQWGGSTKFQGHLFRDCMLRKFRSSMTIAHDLDSARHIREMSERFYVYYPGLKPPRKRESDKWWKFQHQEKGKPADSHYRIDTADELSTGHSLTMHNLHLSEISLWRNAGELVKGLFPTVPKSPDTMILMEGTGSGVGDYWYDFCNAARAGDTDWEFLFVAWFEIEEYVQNFESGKDKALFEKHLDSEERLLLDAGASLEALSWRHHKIKSDFKGDIDSFNQQYPSDPDIAFLSSGRPVFHAPTVRQRMSETEKGDVGNLEWRDKKVVFVSDEKGVWEIFEHPSRKPSKNLYASGGDFSEGKSIETDKGNKGSDFSGVRIFRRDTRKFVATMQARLDPDVVAEEMWKASQYFGGSQCVGVLPEQNAQGGGELVIRRLKTVDVWLLKTPIIGKKSEGQKPDEFGWETMKNTKRLAIDTLKQEIRENTYTDPDKKVWYECSTYVYDEKGRSDAQKGKYDDLVMATALTLQADLLMPMVFKEVKEVKKKIARDVDVPNTEVFTQRELMEETYAAF